MAVIARLDRANQYSGACVMDRGGSGILGHPIKSGGDGNNRVAARANLRNVGSAAITAASLLEPGRICIMISITSQSASLRPKLMLDATWAH